MRSSDNDVDAFWSRVDVGGPDDCWNWQGSYGKKNGYGLLSLRHGVMISAHRFAYMLARGEPIPDGLCVCHRCDNRLCCNPAHLWLGTYLDNNRDKSKKGRSRGGAPRKITDDQIAAIRQMYYGTGASLREVGEYFGISASMTWCFVHGKRGFRGV
jgi:hypothetical protein